MRRSSSAAVLWWLLVLGALGVCLLAGLVPATPAVLGILLLCAICGLADSSLGMGYGSTPTPLLLLAGARG